MWPPKQGRKQHRAQEHKELNEKEDEQESEEHFSLDPQRLVGSRLFKLCWSCQAVICGSAACLAERLCLSDGRASWTTFSPGLEG